MRPSLLDPVFQPVSALPGIGAKIAGLLARLTGRDSADETRVVDLALLLPHGLIDRSLRPGIALSPEGAIVTLAVSVDRHQPAPRGRGNVPYRVFVHDDTGEMALTFFHAKPDWLSRALPVGENVVVSGRIEWFNGRPSMVHPDYMVRESEAASLSAIEPVYPLTAGLSAKVLRRTIEASVARLPAMPSWLEPEFARRQGFDGFAESVAAAHAPNGEADLDPLSKARRRLAYDELLAGQLSLALVRQRIRKLAGRAVEGDGRLQAKIVEALPFSLTEGQEKAVRDVLADMRRDERMLRLLQGDVGSGKTAVAMLAMAAAVEAGGQAVLMAPTEILARQHATTIAEMCAPAGIEIAVLTGRMKAQERRDSAARIATGQAQIIVGTHALFQEAVEFADLRLAVVDEQHRFGVHQRLRLTAKGTAPHMLVMTATPIPRTLVLAAFGDMDVSKLTEKPAGRQPITTVTVPVERIDEVVGRLTKAIGEGRKAYWVCPLVDESEVSDMMSATERFNSLKPVFGERAGLVHGQMSGAAKNAAMDAFKSGETRILVATTVIEVGVDVPDASILVVEHAERFGLAQLHQLRGRVGRGQEASNCILLYSGPLSDTARARLSIMRDSEDGFRIAEEDLKLRGEGELLGTRQSGTPGFRLASLDVHGDLLETARNDARYVLESDPDLTSARGEALRMLLYLFRRDEAIRFLRAG